MLGEKIRRVLSTLSARPRSHVVVALGAAFAAVLLMDFDPPRSVRRTELAPPVPIGDVAQAPFEDPEDPETARLQVRLYAPEALASSEPEDGTDQEPGTLLSAPVMTTVLGVSARVEQAVRIDDDRSLELHVEILPRRTGRTSMEFLFQVRGTVVERGFFGRGERRTVVLATRGDGRRWDEAPMRLGFVAAGRPFVLEIEARLARATPS
ncbi:MAG: hypothetical protein D6705_16975 [Deltaproteobacteria bacterium]|nr:MAG: hypothetical protein D6705_16975 [Deltaproteobacteria bacterium]